MRSRRGGTTSPEGYGSANVLASYVHAHWASNPLCAEGFVNSCVAPPYGEEEARVMRALATEQTTAFAPGAVLDAHRRLLVVRFERPHRTLSWAVVNGGFRVASAVVWRQVIDDELGLVVDPGALLTTSLAELGVPDAVGFLTARDLAAFDDVVQVQGELAARCVATVGLGNALTVGDPPGPLRPVGTINLLAQVSVPLDDGALVEACALVAEARTAAVMEANLPSRRTGRVATGTGTDCIAVAAPEGSFGTSLCRQTHRPRRAAGSHRVQGHVTGRGPLDRRAEARAMMAWQHALAVLGGALAFDLVVGEPPSVIHPVVWMGRMQGALRRLAPRAPTGAFLHGLFMAIVGPAVFGLGSWLIIRALAPLPWLQLLVEIYLLKSAFAVRGLGLAAIQVGRALRRSDLPGARDALRSLVSRNTSDLDPPLLAAAAIESVAENTSDSVVAPLLFFVVGGVPAALAYRAANTLDSLIGYHGDTEWLGKVAARLDDLLNLVPARLTAFLIVCGAAATGASAVGAVRIWWRDGARTESPNAGRPMAAMAGALGLRLEKVDHYCLGDGGALPAVADIDRALRVMAIACSLAMLLFASGVFARAT